MARHLRRDRKQQRQDSAKERQAAYDALTPAEKKARDEAWGPAR